MQKHQKETKSFLDMPIKITRREINEMADKKYRQMQEKLSKKIIHNIAEVIGYIMASTLEAKHGFGKKRNAVIVKEVLNTFNDMSDELCSFEDHRDYWKEKGFSITQTDDEIIVKAE